MWIIPSRSRPHRLATLLAVEFMTPVLVVIDDDDPMLQGYIDLDVPRLIGKRRPLSEIYNDVFANYPDLDWYGFLADDVVPDTPQWDNLLVEAAGSDGLAFGDDGINGEARAPHFVLGGDLVREYGWLSLPGLERLYIDTVWNDIARERDTYRYLPHVIMTHHHFSNGKALYDQTYRKPGKLADKLIYEEWRKHGQTT